MSDKSEIQNCQSSEAGDNALSAPVEASEIEQSAVNTSMSDVSSSGDFVHSRSEAMSADSGVGSQPEISECALEPGGQLHSKIRPPSKIGRPCSMLPPKAGPPPVQQKHTTQQNNNNYDAIRKISEDLNRKTLTDVEEGDENDELLEMMEPLKRPITPHPRPSSSSSMTSNASLDYLWELHGRRLSEAGLRRHSDASVVLTEDTDSFIIGQRVWVGGTKPGLIAYIGETQFAPGDWAGIVLDEPIGKNDGSVAGNRYFQCEPRRGVFSRLTRLTRDPLPQAMTATPSPDSMTGRATTPKRQMSNLSTVSSASKRATSPTNSVRSSVSSVMKKAKSPISTLSPNTAQNHNTGPLKVGERVIVRSSAATGSKPGTLRFIGQTHFAAGEWCGVELDDPIGKNDGSVDNVRYFDCAQFYGLFALSSKVSRSPSTRKPSQCVVHTGSGLNRSNSRESLTQSVISGVSSVRTSASATPSRVRLGINSLNTSASAATAKRLSTSSRIASTPLTKTALQDALKDKEAQVAQLLRERELERAEVTRAATQADHAEQLLAALRKDYDHFRAECEIKLKEKDSALCNVTRDRDAVAAQLEEERRRLEDLQFRLEETHIDKGDLGKINDAKNLENQTNVELVKELKETLLQERAKIDRLEEDSNKLFEAEEALARTKDELDALKKELEEKALKKQDDLSQRDLISALQKEISEYKQQLAKEKVLNETFQKDISEFQLKLSTLSEKDIENKTIIESLQKDVEGYKTELFEKLKEKELQHETLQKEVDNYKNIISEKDREKNSMYDRLQREIDDYKNQLSEKLKEKGIEYETLQKEIDDYKNRLSEKDKEKETLNETLQKVTEDYKRQLLEKLQAKESEHEMLQKEINEYKNRLNNQEKEKENISETLQKEIESYKKQLSEEVQEKQVNSENLKKEINNYKQQLAEKTKEQDTLKEFMQKQIAEIKNELSGKLQGKETEQEALRKEIEDYKTQLSERDSTNESLQTEIGVYKIQLLEKDKEREIQFTSLEKEILELRKKKEEEVKIHNDEITKLKTDLQNKDVNMKQKLEELNSILEKIKSENEELKLNLKETKSEKERSEKLYKDEINSLKQRLQEANEAIELKTKDICDKVKENENKLHNEVDKLRNELNDKVTELEGMQANIKKKDEAIEKLSASDEKLSTEIKNLKSQLNDKVAELQTFTDNIKKKDDAIEMLTINETKLHNEIEKLKSELIIIESDLKASNDNCNKNNNLISKLKSSESNLQNEIEKLKAELNAKNSNLQISNEHSKKYEDTIATLQNKEVEIMSQIEKLNMELSARSYDLEAFGEQNKRKDEMIVTLKTELELAQNELNAKAEEIDNHIRRKREAKEEIEKNLEIAEVALKAKTDELEEHKAQTTKRMLLKDEELIAAQKQIQESKASAAKLQFEIEETKAAIKVTHSQQIEEFNLERDRKIASLTSQYEAKCQDLAMCQDVNTKQVAELHQQSAMIETYKRDFEVLHEKLNKGEKLNGNLTAKISEMELQIGDLVRRLQSSEESTILLTQQKKKLESEITGLATSDTTKDSKLEKLAQEMAAKDALLVKIQAELNAKIGACERHTQELLQATEVLKFEMTKEKKTHTQNMQNTINERDQLRRQLVNLTMHMQQTEVALKSRVVQLQNDFKQAGIEKNLKEVCNAKLSDLDILLQRTISEYQIKLKQTKDEINVLQTNAKLNANIIAEIKAQQNKERAQCELTISKPQKECEQQLTTTQTDYNNVIIRLRESENQNSQLILQINTLIQAKDNLQLIISRRDKEIANCRDNFGRAVQINRRLTTPYVKESQLSACQATVNELLRSKANIATQLNDCNEKLNFATHLHSILRKDHWNVRNSCNQKTKAIEVLQRTVKTVRCSFNKNLQTCLQKTTETTNMVKIVQDKCRADSENKNQDIDRYNLKYMDVGQQLNGTKNCDITMIPLAIITKECRKYVQCLKPRVDVLPCPTPSTEPLSPKSVPDSQVKPDNMCPLTKVNNISIYVPRTRRKIPPPKIICGEKVPEVSEKSPKIIEVPVVVTQQCPPPKIVQVPVVVTRRIPNCNRPPQIIPEPSSCPPPRIVSVLKPILQSCDQYINEIYKLNSVIMNLQNRTGQLSSRRPLSHPKIIEIPKFIRPISRMQNLHCNCTPPRTIFLPSPTSKTVYVQVSNPCLPQFCSPLQSCPPQKVITVTKPVPVALPCKSQFRTIVPKPVLVPDGCTQENNKILQLKKNINNLEASVSNDQCHEENKRLIDLINKNIRNQQDKILVQKVINDCNLKLRPALMEIDALRNNCSHAVIKEPIIVNQCDMQNRQIMALLQQIEQLRNQKMQRDPRFALNLEYPDEAKMFLININNQLKEYMWTIKNVNTELSQCKMANQHLVYLNNKKIQQKVDEIVRLHRFIAKQGKLPDNNDQLRQLRYDLAVATGANRQLIIELNQWRSQASHPLSIFSQVRNPICEIRLKERNGQLRCQLEESSRELVKAKASCNRNCRTSSTYRMKKLQVLLQELQQEKKQYELNVANGQASAVVTSDAQQLLVEKQEAEGQINFLNSIIVDMQHKNEELKAKIEILEMGGPAQIDELYGVELGQPKLIPPRKFCDICDEFDHHDTEDCPKQQSSDSPPPNLHSNQTHVVGKREAQAPPRQYCDFCEVFGHSTEDCNDSETF